MGGMVGGIMSWQGPINLAPPPLEALCGKLLYEPLSSLTASLDVPPHPPSQSGFSTICWDPAISDQIQEDQPG